MIRIILIFLGALASMSCAALAQGAGVGAWENPSYTILRWIDDQKGIGWYYNWRTDQIWQKDDGRADVEFVPMIHNASYVDDEIRSSRNPRALLGFNEPDGHGGDHQAGMSVEQAVALWPRLEARGLRLGSPATTQAGTLGRDSWQRRFMNEVEQRGLRVDFMAVHYYSTNGDVQAFRNWLIAVHKEYRRPIWVTEFAYIDWSRPRSATYDANARFTQDAIQMLEDLPFVERYAWFAANPYRWKGSVPAINLVDDKLRLTPVGEAYTRMVASLAGVKAASLTTGSESEFR